MRQQRVIDFREALKYYAIGGLLLAQFDESADDVNTHGDGAWAVQHIRGLQATMFGECPWTIRSASAAA